MRAGPQTPLRQLPTYLGLVLLFSGSMALVLGLIYALMSRGASATPHPIIAETLSNVFLVLVVLIAIAVWLFMRAHQSRAAAHAETRRQTEKLLQEIEAHQRTDAELQDAKEIADARNLAKSKYIRGISHELRTPLNAVLGYAQLLEASNAVAPHLKHSVRVIRRSSDHLSSLVDGLLDISMIEAGRLQIFRDELSLTDFLDQLVDMFSLQAKENGLEFNFIAPANLPDMVYTDGKRLRQILINLLQNAIRSTRQGSVTLRISYTSQVARFDIEDTGIGIAADDMERIFRPFERIETPNHPARRGTGLGLTITRLLTDAMGGEITVRSTPGLGSCFTVRLMLSPVPATRRQRSVSRTPIIGYQGQRKTILVVDDDPDHIAFMSDALSQLGFGVIAAENGEDCLKAAARSDPDAVLLDISMPGMDGWETAHHLRQNGRRRIPIIIISADPRHESKRIEAAEDHDAYMMKPLRLGALFDNLKTLMDIEWIEAAPDKPEPANLAIDAMPRQNFPSTSQLVHLKQMGEIGHIRGILAKLDEIGIVEPVTAPVLGPLRRLAEDCDLEGYNSMLDAMLRHDA